ncbi:MAG: hypothetical protein AB1458_12995 [Bacteroidota bacterium]
MTTITRIFPLVFLLLFLHAGAQEGKVIIQGTVRDFESQKPVEDALVTAGNLTAKTNIKGRFYLSVQKEQDIHLKLTCISYYPASRLITATELQVKDTLKVLITMKKSLTSIPTVDITPGAKPDTVIGNNNYFVEDFEFWGGNLVLLTYNRHDDLKKSKIVLATENKQELSSLAVPGEAEQLFKDFLGYVNVICKNAVYRIKLTDNQLVLAQISKEDFEYLIMPCVDTIGPCILFSDYRDDYPEFTYYTFNKLDSTAAALKKITDVPLSQLYSFEYEYLKPKEKLYARQVEQETGIDKRQVAAYMTGFTKSRYFTPLYAPLFVVRDTVLVFDHYTDRLYKYDLNAKAVDSVKISYHRPEKWKEWRRQLLKDEVTESIYGLFLKNGFYYLKEISTATGEIAGVSKLSFPYVQKIRIRNGYAYYVYRPFESLQTKFLYREKIFSSNEG